MTATLTPAMRKRLGQYFTGPRLSSLLVQLASADPISVVDPMAGTGDMLSAVLSSGAKPKRMSAVEIEDEAFERLDDRLGSLGFLGTEVQAMHANAFDPTVVAQLGLEDWDLVITNPPYVRYQRSATARGDDAALPTSDEVRLGLRAALQAGRAGGSKYLSYLDRVAATYSGLADLAVPSWLLCAALVREGGTLAMVVPDTWLSRDYARPIQELLSQFFQIEYIVEDADAAWFNDALVRTTLVIARRLDARVPTPESAEGILHIRLSEHLANDRSLVAGLFPDAIDPNREFANAARRWRSARTSTRRRGCDVEWISPQTTGVSDRDEQKNTDAGASQVPARLRRTMRALRPDAVSLAQIGWQVGQGLRTGANAFFYVDLVKELGATVQVQPNSRLWPDVLTVPTDALRPVLRKQQELGHGRTLFGTIGRGRVLDLNRYARSTDIDRASGGSETVGDLGMIPMPHELDAFVTHVEGVNIGSLDEPNFIQQMSAVSTNTRGYDPRKPDRRPRFWYQLPPMTPRHSPDLLIPRVNYRHPRVLLNPDRTFLVDANFSTLWRVEPSALDPRALLEILSGSWAAAAMEASGTVLGGGALKLEATQLSRFPIPAGAKESEQELIRLGSALLGGDDSEAVRKIDALTWQALGLGAATPRQQRVLELADELLEARSR